MSERPQVDDVQEPVSVAIELSGAVLRMGANADRSQREMHASIGEKRSDITIDRAALFRDPVQYMAPQLKNMRIYLDVLTDLLERESKALDADIEQKRSLELIGPLMSPAAYERLVRIVRFFGNMYALLIKWQKADTVWRSTTAVAETRQKVLGGFKSIVGKIQEEQSTAFRALQVLQGGEETDVGTECMALLEKIHEKYLRLEQVAGNRLKVRWRTKALLTPGQSDGDVEDIVK